MRNTARAKQIEDRYGHLAYLVERRVDAIDATGIDHRTRVALYTDCERRVERLRARGRRLAAPYRTERRIA